jgi:hypothetical protein
MSQTIAHRNVTLLRVESPGVLAEIRALVDLTPFVVAQVDDTTLVVDPARTGELAQLLGDAGLAPLVQKVRPSPGVAGPEGISGADTVEPQRD